MTEKTKVESLEIITRMIKDQPYYEIKYKEAGKSYYNIGYSSYNLENVLMWKEECFELVDEKEASGDEMPENEEYCEWKDAGECFDNTEFKIQCEFNPLKRGVVPNNFAHHNFKFCPFCGRRIKWV